MITPSPPSLRSLASPYRVPASIADAASPRVDAPSDSALLGMALLFVLVSLLRASLPLFGNEAFGTEPTLALFAALIVGYHLACDTPRRKTR